MSEPETKKDITLERPEEVLCPSCGFFAGVYGTCPRCGATINKHLSLKIVRYTVVLLATIGLVGLYLWFTQRELPQTTADKITERMTQQPQLKPGAPQDSAPKKTVLQPKTPSGAEGKDEDRGKSASATIAQENLQRIYLDFVAYLRPEHRGKLVQFKGKIIERQIIPPGVKVSFQDVSGKIDIILYRKSFQNSELFYKLNKGYQIRVMAKVGEYQGKLQLIPRAENDIEILRKPQSTTKITTKDKSQTAKPEKPKPQVTVTATLGPVYMILPGVKINLRNVEGLVVQKNGRQVTKKYSEAILRAPSFGDLDYIHQHYAYGNKVEVTGYLSKYRGRFQIEIQRASHIKVLKVAPAKPQKPTSPDTPEIAHYLPRREVARWYPLHNSSQLKNAGMPVIVSGILTEQDGLLQLPLKTGKVTVKLPAHFDKNTYVDKRVTIKGTILAQKSPEIYVVAISKN